MGIPYGKQFITEEDVKAVTDVLKSDYLTQGPVINEFEKQFASYCNAKYAVAVSNGTAGLHLATLALGIQEDEYIITTPITFVASSNCVSYCNGNVIFADINPETFLIDSNSILDAFKKNTDKKIVGIIPVNFAGKVVELDKIKEIANKYNCWIIEDACHSPGGYFIDEKQKKQISGNGKFADLSVFSFHPVKHIATGEGGMITTNNEALYNSLLTLRTHGITRNTNDFINSIDFVSGNSTAKYSSYPAWYMEMQALGYNYRLTDFQAALGISQLKRANEGLALRKELVKKYITALTGAKGMIYIPPYDEGNAYHLLVVQVENRRGLYDFLRSHEVFTQIHYFPVHLMPFYQNKGWKIGDLLNAEKYYAECISLPLFPTLSEEEFNLIIDLIKEFYTKN
jgi:UDP-4-amino-4,6-dideoxy-N-acetyl-beta-L-altrosamine transaminase